ncbi:hypothetical protein TREES_T100009642 [Tupaia chinensis]|uniref:Uncharacterized protein n=1 Tax=Tupaia chinensis TaxID=246437 RepID=L9LC50_TUPCH|nr:hypothetical protein TREES_T100009642 [Tupaia chinensis]
MLLRIRPIASPRQLLIQNRKLPHEMPRRSWGPADLLRPLETQGRAPRVAGAGPVTAHTRSASTTAAKAFLPTPACVHHCGKSLPTHTARIRGIQVPSSLNQDDLITQDTEQTAFHSHLDGLAQTHTHAEGGRATVVGLCVPGGGHGWQAPDLKEASPLRPVGLCRNQAASTSLWNLQLYFCPSPPHPDLSGNPTGPLSLSENHSEQSPGVKR